MAREIRMLPALMAVSASVLLFKAAAIAEAAGEATAAEEAKEDQKKDDKSSDKEAGAENSDEPSHDDYFADYDEFATPEEGGSQSETCVAEVDFTTETGLSQYEIQVLRSLSERREQLDQRIAEIETREQMAAAAEQRIDDQITELKELEAGVQELLSAMEAKRDERLDALVKVYETMKPKDAARIFETLQNAVLLKVSQRMKSASLAAVMSAMSPERAQELTLLLASRAQLPETAEELKEAQEAL